MVHNIIKAVVITRRVMSVAHSGCFNNTRFQDVYGFTLFTLKPSEVRHNIIITTDKIN